MNNSLDFSQDEFKRLLNQASDLVLKQFENLDQQRGYNSNTHTQQEIEGWFNEPLPEQGITKEEVLQLVEEKIVNKATGNLGPHMYAYVMAGGNQMAIIAEMIATTINQNGGKWHLSPSINEIEKRIAKWAAEMIGFTKNVGGVMVSGGSAANFSGLTVARNVFFEQQNIRSKGLFNQQPFTVYASSEVHNCVDKSIEALGIGTNQLRKIEVDSDFKINIEALKLQIKTDIENGFLPFCIIGTAGTVNTGAIDDLEALANVAKTHNMWFHIDGAYGGLVATLPNKKALYKGIELADSVALDFHKWLYQPFEAGYILVRDWSLLKRSYFTNATYLDSKFESTNGRLEFNEHNFQLSRNAKALKVWMSIKAYGMQRIRDMIQKDIDLTQYLSNQLKATTDFRVIADSELAICCFQYTGNLTDDEAIQKLNKQIIPELENDGRVFIMGTTLNNQFVIRACIINHRKTTASIDYLIKVIREVGERLANVSK